MSSVWCVVWCGETVSTSKYFKWPNISTVYITIIILLWLLEVYNRSCFKKYKLYVVTLICVLLVTLINDFCSGAKLLRQIYLVLLSLAWCRAVHCSSLDGNKKVIIWRLYSTLQGPDYHQRIWWDTDDCFNFFMQEIDIFMTDYRDQHLTDL